MTVRDHMDELTHLEAGDLGHHMGEHRILDHVPVVGSEHILGALVQDRVELVAGHIESHGVGGGQDVAVCVFCAAVPGLRLPRRDDCPSAG